MQIERGDILLADLDPTKGSEIRKTRPVIVVTNNIANKFAPIITVVPITSQNVDKIRVFDASLIKASGLSKKSKAVIAQIRTIDKSRIQKKIGKVSITDLKIINSVIKLHLDLENL